MIQVTRLDGREMLLNPELLESIESTPETVVTLSNGRKLVVRESPQELAERVTNYRRKIAGVGVPDPAGAPGVGA